MPELDSLRGIAILSVLLYHGFAQIGTVGLFGVPAQYATLWSLSVEEHFYLLWPALMRRISKTGAMIACSTILVICPALRWIWGAGGYTWLVADGLALGAMLAVFVHGHS